MLAMVVQTPQASRKPASPLTPIATVRRLDMLAPTGNMVHFVGGGNGDTSKKPNHHDEINDFSLLQSLR